jgi:hypothetical protein
MPAAVLAALGIGVALFVASSALSLRILGGPLLVARLLVIVGMGLALVVVGSVGLPPLVPLAIVATALLVIVAAEQLAAPTAGDHEAA